MLNLILAKGSRLQGARFGMSAELRRRAAQMVLAGHSLARPRSRRRASTSPEAAATYSVLPRQPLAGEDPRPAGVRAAGDLAAARPRAPGRRCCAQASTPTIPPASAPAAAAVVVAPPRQGVDGRRPVGTRRPAARGGDIRAAAPGAAVHVRRARRRGALGPPRLGAARARAAPPARRQRWSARRAAARPPSRRPELRPRGGRRRRPSPCLFRVRSSDPRATRRRRRPAPQPSDAVLAVPARRRPGDRLGVLLTVESARHATCRSAALSRGGVLAAARSARSLSSGGSSCCS